MISSPPVWCVSTKLRGDLLLAYRDDSVDFKFSIKGSAMSNVTRHPTCCSVKRAQRFETSLTHLQARSYHPATEAIYHIKGRALFVDVEAAIAAKLPGFVQPRCLSGI